MLSTTEHGYVLPFEVVSILLLAAMVGCIVIAMKPSAGNIPTEEIKIKPVHTERIIVSSVNKQEKAEEV
jgi:NADH-quinone oxidoreductase subunit J